MPLFSLHSQLSTLNSQLSIVCQQPSFECTEFQFIKQFHQGGDVGVIQLQFLFVKGHGSIQHNGSQVFRHQSLFCIVPDVFRLFAFQLVHVSDDILHTAIFSHKKRGVFLAYARDARDVVGGIAPEAKDINHLSRLRDSIFFADIMRAQNLSRSAEFGWFVDKNLVGDQLSEVLIGGHHISDETLLFGLVRKCSDDIVSLISLGGVNGDVKTLDKPNDIRYGSSEVVGHRFTVGFVFRIFLGAHRGSMKVEGHPDMGGLFIAQHVIQGVQEAHNSRGVKTLRVHGGTFAHRKESPINQCVGIEKK